MRRPLHHFGPTHPVTPRMPALAPTLPLILVLVVAGAALMACDSAVQPSPARPSGGASIGPPGAASPAPSPPTPAGFWSTATRAMSATQRLRVIVVGRSPNELRFEPRASAALDEGELLTVCIEGQAYEIDGFRARPRPARWTCGSSAFVSSFRRAGHPLEAWNASVPTDTRVREQVMPEGRDRWRWEYSATSPTLDGPVRATLVMDAATGRLVSGSRTDPKGEVRYMFNYTTLFLPVQLP